MSEAKGVTVFACTMCANYSYTGGVRGMQQMKILLSELGIEMAAAKCITMCCGEEIMRQAVRINRRSLSGSDALVVISCAAGVKSALLCEPGLPVITVVDSVGSVPVTRRYDPVALSYCASCGHCVITYTGGICPLSECPSQSKYGPCEKSPQDNTVCVVNGRRMCIWEGDRAAGRSGSLKRARAHP